jgi:allophanate hydrolase
VAVSAGLVTFSLGTDTAGSGRVPAALTNTVGTKPSFGLVSTSGLLPACRSLDCASVFSLTVADGALVLSVLAGRDEGDAWSRDLPVPSPRPVPRPLHTLVLAVPRPADIDFAGNRATESAWSSFLDALLAAGVQLVETSFTPFYDAGRKLYAGGWLAERLSGIEAFLDENPDAVHPVISRVLSAGRSTPGTQVFRDFDEARRIAAGIAPLWRSVDALLTPTVTTTFTVEEMLADPIALNSRLGQFTTFTNILDLAAIAVPCSIASNGLPFGVTVSAPAGSDGSLAGIAAAIERLVGGPLGATGYARVSADRPSLPAETGGGGGVDDVLLAVVGAHLSGMPLNGELTDLGATFAMRTATAAVYRLHALPGTVPPKPALRRVSTGGVRIEVEVYRLDARAFGRFVSLVASPLAIGTVELADGSTVHGFVCEPHAFDGAPDVSEFGGWRAYRRQ